MSYSTFCCIACGRDTAYSSRPCQRCIGDGFGRSAARDRRSERPVSPRMLDHLEDLAEQAEDAGVLPSDEQYHGAAARDDL